jgi:biotin carboxyl carrier protein
MNIRVTLAGKTFDVEVADLNARPIVAVVEGERFEVWPEEGLPAEGSPVEGPSPVAARPGPQPANPPTPNAKSVLAPLPGIIVAVSVQPGAEVTVGQELCMLEAMKMKNAIRAPRAGRIAAVHVAAGQTVKHRAPLVEFAE